MVTRLPRLLPGQLDDAQRELLSAIVGGPRARSPFRLSHEDGSLAGPFNAMLYAPSVGSAQQQLGAAIRYRTSLSERIREMAILTVAAHCDSAFERYAHELVGRDIGLTEAELSMIRAENVLPLTDPRERVAIHIVRELVHASDLDDDIWRSGIELLGPTALVELTALVGYYTTLALQMRVFRADSPPVD